MSVDTVTPDTVEQVPNEIMSVLGHNMQQTNELKQTTESHDEVISKLKQVFSPEEPKADAWYDDVLRAAMEAEKHNQPIPLTVKIATKLREAQEQNQELERKLAKVAADQQAKNDPAYQADVAAYNNIDMYIGQELKSYFGDNIPKSVAAGITSDLVEKIREEQQTNPQRWRNIRSDPQTLQRIVQNAVAQTVPPQARRIAQQYEDAQATYTPDQCKEAVLEAAKLLRDPEVQKNPELMQKVSEAQTRAREMYWEAVFPGKNKRSMI